MQAQGGACSSQEIREQKVCLMLHGSFGDAIMCCVRIIRMTRLDGVCSALLFFPFVFICVCAIVWVLQGGCAGEPRADVEDEVPRAGTTPGT